MANQAIDIGIGAQTDKYGNKTDKFQWRQIATTAEGAAISSVIGGAGGLLSGSMSFGTALLTRAAANMLAATTSQFVTNGSITNYSGIPLAGISGVGGDVSTITNFMSPWIAMDEQALSLKRGQQLNAASWQAAVSSSISSATSQEIISLIASPSPNNREAENNANMATTSADSSSAMQAVDDALFNYDLRTRVDVTNGSDQQFADAGMPPPPPMSAFHSTPVGGINEFNVWAPPQMMDAPATYASATPKPQYDITFGTAQIIETDRMDQILKDSQTTDEQWNNWINDTAAGAPIEPSSAAYTSPSSELYKFAKAAAMAIPNGMSETVNIIHDTVELGLTELDRAAGAYHPYKFDSGLFNSVANSDDPGAVIAQVIYDMATFGLGPVGRAAKDAEERHDLTVMTEPLGNFVGGHLPAMIPASRGLMTRIFDTKRPVPQRAEGEIILPQRPSEPIEIPDIPQARLPSELEKPRLILDGIDIKKALREAREAMDAVNVTTLTPNDGLSEPYNEWPALRPGAEGTDTANTNGDPFDGGGGGGGGGGLITNELHFGPRMKFDALNPSVPGNPFIANIEGGNLGGGGFARSRIPTHPLPPEIGDFSDPRYIFRGDWTHPLEAFDPQRNGGIIFSSRTNRAINLTSESALRREKYNIDFFVHASADIDESLTYAMAHPNSPDQVLVGLRRPISAPIPTGDAAGWLYILDNPANAIDVTRLSLFKDSASLIAIPRQVRLADVVGAIQVTRFAQYLPETYIANPYYRGVGGLMTRILGTGRGY